MKRTLKVAVIALALGASSAFAQGMYPPDTTERSARESRDSAYGQSERGAMPWQSNRDMHGQMHRDSTFWYGVTMSPYREGDDIRNANSALWGVGG